MLEDSIFLTKLPSSDFEVPLKEEELEDGVPRRIPKRLKQMLK
jgi:hypothetical protein